LSVPDRQRSWWEVVRWWELRRLPYSLAAGSAAVAGVVLLLLVDTLPPRLPPAETDFEYLFAPLVGLVLANVAYTGGWVTELLVRRATGGAPRFGPVAWTVGLAFSVLCALAPAAVNAVLWAARALA
jgi:hypothetical protein